MALGARIIRYAKLGGLFALLILFLAIGIWIYGKRQHAAGRAEGETRERAEADIERVQQAEEAGDAAFLRDDILKRSRK